MRIGRKQEEEYCYENKFNPSTRSFFAVITLSSKGYHEKFIVNFHHLNKEISKYRKKPFVRATLNYVRDQILSSSAVKVLKQHSAYVYEIILLPLNGQKKIEQNEQNLTEISHEEKAYDADAASDTELLSEKTGIEQQQLIETNILCQSAGINYDRVDLPKIAKYGIHALKVAISMLEERSLTSIIKNPEGWLRRCLECGWYKEWSIPDIPVSILEQFWKLRSYLINVCGIVPA
jgi:hypothetical protein